MKFVVFLMLLCALLQNPVFAADLTPDEKARIIEGMKDLPPEKQEQIKNFIKRLGPEQLKNLRKFNNSLTEEQKVELVETIKKE